MSANLTPHPTDLLEPAASFGLRQARQLLADTNSWIFQLAELWPEENRRYIFASPSRPEWPLMLDELGTPVSLRRTFAHRDTLAKFVRDLQSPARAYKKPTDAEIFARAAAEVGKPGHDAMRAIDNERAKAAKRGEMYQSGD